MKLLRAFLILLTLFAAVFFAVSCQNTSVSTIPFSTKAPVFSSSTPLTTAPDPDETTDSSPTETPVGKLTLAGRELSDYRIVYAESEYQKLRPVLQGTEYDFYKLTAEKIAEDIEKLTGVKLSVVSESAETVPYEILVGPTSREESADVKTLGIYEHICRMVNGKLVIGGGTALLKTTGNLREYYTYASTYHAFDKALAELTAALKSGDHDLPADYDASGKTHFKTVACVGDSITEGVGSSNSNYAAYPAVLQRVLWQDHIVVNFGNSGKTMRNDVGSNYTGTTQYNALMQFAKNVDLVLIMLGTNDSNRDRFWTAGDDLSYNGAALELTSRLRRMNPDMKITVMNCPVYYGTEGSGSPHVRNLQAKLPEYLAGEGIEGVMAYDMHTLTAEKLGKSCFPDLLHPNDRGYGIMAKALAEVIPEMLAGSWRCQIALVEDPTGDAPDVAIAEGAESILKKDLDTLYPFDNSPYRSWQYGGAPYLFTDLTAFGGYTVTNIEMPVAQTLKGDTFTVRVVKYSHPNITETLATYTLTADFTSGVSWAKFGGLSIEVPKGYTLAFGKSGDTMQVLYLGTPVTGYTFYNNSGGADLAVSLAFNIYGIPSDEVDSGESEKKVTDGSVNLFGNELDGEFPITAYRDWAYSGAPYTYADLSLFEGRTVTDLELPVGSASQGSTMALSVVKIVKGKITETYQSYTLTAEKSYQNEWVLFTGLSIAVPEGYTIAFGSPSDTLKLKYIPTELPSRQFYNRDGGISTGASVALNVWATASSLEDTVDGEKNLLNKDLSHAYPFGTPKYDTWKYATAPYALMDTDCLAGKTVTAIRAPIVNAAMGSSLTVSVVKLTAGRVSETLKTYRLTCERAYQNEWVLFTGLSIAVPEGYTIAFGSANDGAVLGFVNFPVEGYSFYTASNGAVNTSAAILFNFYGKDS